MQFFYSALFTVAIEHDYYGTLACSDLTIEPTAETVKTLQQNGWILRGVNSGFKIIAKVKADAVNPQLPSKTLFYDLDAGEMPVLRFMVGLKNPNFYNFTDVDKTIRSGKTVFYLNNIHDFKTTKGKFLKNSPVLPIPNADADNDKVPDSKTIFGTPLKWLNQTVYRNTFSVAVDAPKATVKLKAEHLATKTVLDLGEQSFDFPPIHPPQTVAYTFDLSKADNLIEGLYTFSDDKGNSETVFYAPENKTGAPIGVIELFSKTGKQPFLNADNSLNGHEYKMRFAAKEVILQYQIENISQGTDGKLRIKLNDINIFTVSNGVVANNAVPDDFKREITIIAENKHEKGAFTSNQLMKLNEKGFVPTKVFSNKSTFKVNLPQPHTQLLPIWNEAEARYYLRISTNI